MSRYSKAAIILAVAFAAACAGHKATLKPVDGAAADAARAEGVQMTVAGGGWTGHPAELEGSLTPLRVDIRNNSGRALRVRFDEIKLISPAGREYAALPPYEIDETMTDTVDKPLDPEFAHDRFFVVPYASRHFTPGLRPWNEPFAYDAAYYGPRYAEWPAYSRRVEVQLPTEDMVSRGLPEGVLEDGGSVSGFVYFQKVPGSLDRVDFRAELVDARTGEEFGTVTVPLAVTP